MKFFRRLSFVPPAHAEVLSGAGVLSKDGRPHMDGDYWGANPTELTNNQRPPRWKQEERILPRSTLSQGESIGWVGGW
jgi:hypothetical protein